MSTPSITIIDDVYYPSSETISGKSVYALRRLADDHAVGWRDTLEDVGRYARTRHNDGRGGRDRDRVSDQESTSVLTHNPFGDLGWV